jgi:hypothetical protein
MPPSSIVRPEDAGKRAHTNIILLKPPSGFAGKVNPAQAPPASQTPGGTQGASQARPRDSPVQR